MVGTILCDKYDAIVVGGGFYGCKLALALADSRRRVAVVESETELMTRASYINQARVHNGYHYPRSYLTACRSAANFARFVAEFHDCIDDTFEQVYAIAKNNSKVSAGQFKRFCWLIKAPIRPVSSLVRRLLNPDLIEDAFAVTEYAFDAVALRRIMQTELEDAGVDVLCGSPVLKVASARPRGVSVHLENGSRLIAETVISCVYASMNELLCRSGLPPLPLKHELAEVALITVPPQLAHVGVTVMDGPFFATMPFPARHLHSLTHVRYTPHRSWRVAGAPKLKRSRDTVAPNYAYMLRDAQRFVPALCDSRYEESIFEVKTLLVQNEIDDGRPIVFRKDYGIENFSVVMGSKIDNIYDALRALQAAGIIEQSHRGAHA
jgi:glycine/D-amino acid oxidase-like deaminating enzyme